ncbi:glycine betaine ABC transporter substrate-binding protein [Candidatus Litorirhabdus singularis]|nr:glycine betaine ABC transporter substrate-binding protein [Candidatus Litorirhabdus singularis]
MSLSIWLALGASQMAAKEKAVVASKAFTESHILAEITAQLLEARGFEVERKLGLGGSMIAFEGLRQGELDVYPEYTGTLTEAILKQPELSRADLNAALAERGLVFRVELGFNNSYAIAVTEATARARGLKAISDLSRQPDLLLAFSHEFLNRGDGWPALQSRYGLPQQPTGIEHALAYPALDNGQLDVTDAYTTDGELSRYQLRLLSDDRNFFPTYDAGLLTRQDSSPALNQVLEELANAFDETNMRALNQRVANDGEAITSVAADFLHTQGLIANATSTAPTQASRILNNTLVHLKLTSLALALGCLVAIPLTLTLARRQRAASALLYVTGLLQTIPALALLALLIPLVGLGELPAIIALFLYSLLPIVRNTLTALFNIDPLLKQVAAGLGLSPTQQLLKIELPLAAPTILAGVKTAAIISIGTATLAAFVGAGGLGEPIITGLTLNDHSLILEGAIPAALLAITVELIFEAIERFVIPAHLRVS